MKENIINKKNIVIVIAIIAVMLIGSAMAYFTDKDNAVNSFTVGNISVEVQEPGWNPDDAKNIVPNQVIAKDPLIYNDGANPAYVFMQVKVPAASVETANDDGSRNAAAKQDLFTYTANDNWKLLKKTAAADSSTYIYAYVGADGNMKSLEAGAKTNALFDNVKFINVIEGQLDGKNLSIDIDVMGIQSDNIDTKIPSEVYSLITNQSK